MVDVLCLVRVASLSLFVARRSLFVVHGRLVFAVCSLLFCRLLIVACCMSCVV